MSIKLELLQYSYWEHFKSAKDLALVLSISHPKRKELENTLSEILKEIKELKEVEARIIVKNKL